LILKLLIKMSDLLIKNELTQIVLERGITNIILDYKKQFEDFEEKYNRNLRKFNTSPQFIDMKWKLTSKGLVISTKFLD
jgi:hypothetical protein